MVKKLKTIICPECNGCKRKDMTGFPCGDITCNRCEGTGTIFEETVKKGD